MLTFRGVERIGFILVTEIRALMNYMQHMIRESNKEHLKKIKKHLTSYVVLRTNHLRLQI